MSDILKRCLFVIGRQRSGTTVFRRALATHPDVRDLGEVMHPGYENGFYAHLKARLCEGFEAGVHGKWFDILAETIDDMAGNDPKSMRYVVDVKYNMALAFGSTLRPEGPASVFTRELQRHNASVVQVVRRNKLHLLVSERVAIKTDQWELSGDAAQQDHATVHLDPVTLLAAIRAEEVQDRYFQDQTRGIGKKAMLAYENMFDGRTGAFTPAIFAKVARFLAIENSFDLQPKLQKQARPMADSISNHGDIQRALKVLVRDGHLPGFYANLF